MGATASRWRICRHAAFASDRWSPGRRRVIRSRSNRGRRGTMVSRIRCWRIVRRITSRIMMMMMHRCRHRCRRRRRWWRRRMGSRWRRMGSRRWRRSAVVVRLRRIPRSVIRIIVAWWVGWIVSWCRMRAHDPMRPITWITGGMDRPGLGLQRSLLCGRSSGALEIFASRPTTVILARHWHNTSFHQERTSIGSLRLLRLLSLLTTRVVPRPRRRTHERVRRRLGRPHVQPLAQRLARLRLRLLVAHLVQPPVPLVPPQESAAAMTHDQHHRTRHLGLLATLGHQVRRLEVSDEGAEASVAHLGIGPAAAAAEDVVFRH
mmetsp:Transcript_23287/g.49170  ORF Transcript_23287/g.49170 Transcript_23287/m.49170 type:complete len:319 (-) Transcript_23287:2052-3008(-)